MNTPGAPAAVELRDIHLRFGRVQANAGINLRVRRGSIHGIVGENGAGKSTAMRILYGMFQPDSGEILLQGQPRTWRSPANAMAAGLGMVHQHFMLADTCTGLDNILLGAEPARFGILGRKAARDQLESAARQYGMAVPLDKPIHELSVGQQQRIEILKLLYRDAEILILDEPTAVLTPQETEALFGNLVELKRRGKTILLVTHKLKEVLRFTDAVTVFRAGKVTGEMPTSEATAEGLARMMVGRAVRLGFTAAPGSPQKESALRVTELHLRRARHEREKISGVSFHVQCGEIVGVAGVEGNGQSELLQAILHPADPLCRTSGRIEMLGNDVTRWSAARLRAAGLAVVPEDRWRDGMMLERSLAENFLLGQQHRPEFRRGGFVARGQLRNSLMQAIEKYDIRPPDPSATPGRLSGGNQQKLVLARELQHEPKLLIAAQPTRGVDVGAIELIHTQLIAARDRGAGVLLISSELDEILALSDRILVLYEGRVAGEFKRGEASEEELGLRMAGISSVPRL
jgi:general nucleoside transport system ATP-binding protein